MKITRLSATAVIIALTLALLVIAQELILPLVVAVGVWFLVNAISDGIGRIPGVGPRIPTGLRRTAATVIILGFIWLSVEIIVRSVNDMVALAPSYNAKLAAFSQQLLASVGQDQLPSLTQFLTGVDIQPLIGVIGGTITAFTGDFFLVILYTAFLLLEQGTFPGKWRAMFASDEAYDRSRGTLLRVGYSIRQYALVKTSTNLLTAGISLVTMLIAGQDFALFWAFLIFLLNYIPTFGSMAAVALPGAFAFLQFEGWITATIVVAGIVMAHGVVGYLLEPRLLGKTLNISPLVVLISLSVWGMVWGVMGMILAVPIMVSLMIVLAAIPSTRPIAVWLSANGVLEEPGSQD